MFALGLWLSLTPQAWGQERNEQGISFIYKGIESPKKFFQPEGQPPQTRADEMFDLTGCWSCLSEVGSAGGGMSLNTHLPEGYLLIWFNADGTYYQQLGSGGSILVYRRWWNLGGLSFGDSDGFVMQTMSYADGVLTYRGSNIDNPEYSTTVVLKRYNKISLNIGAGTGYLGVKVDKLLKGAAADGETKLRIDVKDTYEYREGDEFVLIEAAGKGSLYGDPWAFDVELPDAAKWAVEEQETAEGYRLVLKTNTPDAITAAQASPQAGIYAEAGRVCVSAEAGTPIRIYSADGRLLREAVAHSGLNAFGGLEGMVIVSAGATTKKITVKQ